MARKQVEGQLDLIEDSPEMKAVKRQLKEYDKLKLSNKEQHSANTEALTKKRDKVFEAVKAAGIEPDAEGAYTVIFDSTEWTFRQDAQLKIKKHAVKDDATFDEMAEDE